MHYPLKHLYTPDKGFISEILVGCTVGILNVKMSLYCLGFCSPLYNKSFFLILCSRRRKVVTNHFKKKFFRPVHKYSKSDF